MTPDTWVVIGTAIALAALILNSFRKLDDRIRKLDDRISKFDERFRENGERMAKLEGLLEGLREAISGRRAA